MFWAWSLLPLAFAATPALSWWWGWPGLTGLVGFVLLPLVEWFWGRHARLNPQWGESMPRIVMLLVLAQPPALLAVMGLGVPWPGITDPGEPPLWRVVVLGAACGSVAGAVGIVLAHELGHRRHRLDRALSRALLSMLGWGHYLIEHNQGHHRHAALRHDPATARRHESLWAFLPRYWWGVWRGAVKLSAHQRGPLNEAWALAAITVALWAGAWWVAGPAGLAFMVAQALVAQLLVGCVDYMEHWGLQRRTDPNGRPERVGAAHVWDCRNAASDLLLFNLPRHAHHHREPWHGADALRHSPTSPQMPTGYAGMVLLTLVPPLFRRVMTPRLPADHPSPP